MSHISSIGAGVFSDLAVAMPSTELTQVGIQALVSAATFQALFASGIANIGGTKAANTFVRFDNVREFPALGTPANIVNVPAFGSKTSRQVQGQADAPTLEITVNYVPSDWAKDGTAHLGTAVGDGVQRAFRFTLLNAVPTGSGATQYASTAPGLGTVQNSQFYWVGRIEALQVNPNLTDANQATITLSLQTDFYGAYTI
jgi:hypothetical protein